MITWCTLAELDADLAALEPIGLRLHPFLSAWTAAELATVLPGAGEECVEPGLSPARAWAGHCDDVPFAIRAAPSPYRAGVGLEVALPVCLAGARPLVDVVTRLPLPPVASLLFTPVATGRVAVWPAGATAPIGCHVSHEDAMAIARYADGALGGGHALRDDDTGPPWLVVGPACGRFASRVEEIADATVAEARALELSRELRVPFRVTRMLG